MVDHTYEAVADDAKALLEAIRRIVQCLHASSRASEKRIGVSAAQLFVLRTLAASDGLSINELAARTFTHQSTVSVVVSRLEERRLVRRRTDPADARRRLLALTPAGRRLLTSAPGAAQELLVSAVLAMPSASRRSTARALGQLADAMAAPRRPQMFLEAGGRA